MKRDIVITFSLFTLLILLLLGSVFTANAGQGKGAGNSGGNGGGIKRDKKAEISAKKITEKITDKIKKQKGNSKAGEDEYETGREFPMMFDIADRAQKHKAKKAKQKGYK